MSPKFLTAGGLLLFLAAIDSTIAAKPSSGCGNTPKLVTANSSTTPLNMTVNSKSRQYFVKLPQNYDKNHLYRLIYTLHALAGTASEVVAGTDGYLPWYGLPPLVKDTIDAIYIAPNGLSNGWANNGGEDVTFISQLNMVLSQDLCIDENLRFSTGFSFGAAMSYQIACSLAKDFRAVAVLSGNPNISGPCIGGNDPIAYYGEHGVSDQVLPIAGGHTMRDQFVHNNNCTAQNPQEPTAGSGKHIKTTYAGCSPGHPVVWVAFDGPHTPQPMDSGMSQTFANTETWEFFSQFT